MRKILFAVAIALPLSWSAAAFAEDAAPKAEPKKGEVHKKGGKKGAKEAKEIKKDETKKDEAKKDEAKAEPVKEEPKAAETK